MSNSEVVSSGLATPPVVNLAHKIKVEHVHLQTEGFVYREVVVHLEKGVTPAIVAEDGSIWSNVQGSGMALKQLDHVVIIGADMDFLLDCWCASATATSVSLSPAKVVRLPPRSAILPSDENYQVVYEAGSYGLIRKSDGLVLMTGLPTASHAAAEMANRYPKKA